MPLCTGLVYFVRTQDEGAMCSKITIGMMLPEFRLGELRGSGGRAVALVNFRVVVLGLETR